MMWKARCWVCTISCSATARTPTTSTSTATNRFSIWDRPIIRAYGVRVWKKASFPNIRTGGYDTPNPNTELVSGCFREDHSKLPFHFLILWIWHIGNWITPVALLITNVILTHSPWLIESSKSDRFDGPFTLGYLDRKQTFKKKGHRSFSKVVSFLPRCVYSLFYICIVPWSISEFSVWNEKRNPKTQNTSTMLMVNVQHTKLCFLPRWHDLSENVLGCKPMNWWNMDSMMFHDALSPL